MPLALRGEAGRWWAGSSSGEGPRPAQRRGPSLRVRQMTWPTSWRVASTTKAGASREADGRVRFVRCGGEAGYLQCSCFPCKVWKPPRSVWCGLSSSAFIVDRDGVAVRVSERERPAEGAIDRLGQDRHVVLGELVVKGLGVVGPQP
jgi:hypothetical protein